jgi:glucokinase
LGIQHTGRHPLVAGIDIGGTQCSVSLGRLVDGGLDLIWRDQFPTEARRGPAPILADLTDRLRHALKHAGETGAGDVAAIGVSCGGPLDSAAGVVQSPPNLPGWDDVPVTKVLADSAGLPCFLENDANAGALAELHFGAAAGCRNVIFLTFGTGLGAGLILDGQLYAGAGGLAGEVGHWRVAGADGPVHHSKAGSLESICSGSGIASSYAYLAGSPADREALTAQAIAQRARAGEPLARRVFDDAARQLGMAVAYLADLLAPDVVVIGGIYGYAHDLLSDGVDAVVTAEVLPAVRRRLRVAPAGLGPMIGSYASCCVALHRTGYWDDGRR